METFGQHWRPTGLFRFRTAGSNGQQWVEPLSELARKRWATMEMFGQLWRRTGLFRFRTTESNGQQWSEPLSDLA